MPGAPPGITPAHNKQALALIASGEVPVADLITHRLPLDGVLDDIAVWNRPLTAPEREHLETNAAPHP